MGEIPGGSDFFMSVHDTITAQNPNTERKFHMEQIFYTTEFTVSHLIDKIDTGELGLPELQRPFVWKNTKVRDLFDRVYPRAACGAPCGDYTVSDANGFFELLKVGAALGAQTPNVFCDHLIPPFLLTYGRACATIDLPSLYIPYKCPRFTRAGFKSPLRDYYSRLYTNCQ